MAPSLQERQELLERLARIERREERYRRIVETTSEGVWMLDARLRTVFVNEALTRMTGYTRDELLGRGPADVLAPDQVATAGPRLERRRSSRPSESFETSLRRSDGEILPVLVTATPLRDDAGEYAGVLALCTDITSRAAAEVEKAQLEERLQRAQTLEGIGNLAGQIAHDFNNVLAVILNYALFVRDRLPEGERLRDDLEAILQAAEHGAGLTRQLLLFSRRDAGTPEVLDLNEVVRATVRLVAKSAPKGVKIQERIIDVPAPVLIDATQLRQVVMNLVDNAFDAMPNGGEMVVATRTVELDEHDARVRVNLGAGAYAVLSIVDAGHGMEPDVAARAIEPMFTTKPRGSGTGFGLSIANGIVEQAGGHLELRSTPHVGTTVEAFLPVTDAPAVAPPVREWIAATSDVHSGKLLLVEDDDAVREMTSRILTHRGYEVVEAPNAAAALEIGLDGIDLLLTDNAMPNMTGVELVDRLRAVSRGIPVIVMSGYVAEATVEAGDAPGIFWLQKPFGATTLLAAVQGALAAAAR